MNLNFYLIICNLLIVLVGDLDAQSLKVDLINTLSKGVKAAPVATILEVESLGARVTTPLRNSNLLEVDFKSISKTTNDVTLRNLTALSAQVTFLDLSFTKISDIGLKYLSNFKNLNRLNLSNTKISSAGLIHLKNLNNLEYLNLYATEVSDSGLEHLKELKRLKKLFLWQSKVTYEAADRLRDDCPHLLVNTGYDPNDGRGRNMAKGAQATSPDNAVPQGPHPPDKANDGSQTTYWDDVDNQKLYALKLNLKSKEKVSCITITGYLHQNYSPKDFKIIINGKVVKTVKDAKYNDNLYETYFPAVWCESIEIRITGYYGPSPAIRELGLYHPRAAIRAKFNEANK